jgi:hypothetical protein
MKRIFSICLLLFSCIFEASLPAYAATTITPQPPVTSSAPGLVITAFAGNPILDFAELYNQSDDPIALKDGRLQFTVIGNGATGQVEQTATLPFPSAWILPHQYLTFERGVNSGTSIAFSLDGSSFLSGLTSPRLSTLELQPSGAGDKITINIPTGQLTATNWAQHKQRGKSTLSMSGVFATDYSLKTTAATAFSDPLYTPPENLKGLVVAEILANARSCTPTDTSLDCGDYVKLFNSGNEAIDLSLYQLRSDSGGLKPSTTNTFSMSGVLAPGAYSLMRLKDNGDPMSLTNTGGYVWLEDAEGVKKYEPMYDYPDVSADSKKGLSWAYDSAALSWNWMTPAPEGKNYWPAPEPQPIAPIPPSISTTVADCGPGRERNPATNRCRNIVAATAATTSLVPCKDNQERNPETNRCRSVLSASTSLIPCSAGEVRNPETNRCKKTISAAVASLNACKEGQERNPTTNRCRKIVGASSKIADVKDVEAKTVGSSTSWWITGFALVGAMGYGVYEWRQEIRQKMKQLLRTAQTR